MKQIFIFVETISKIINIIITLIILLIMAIYETEKIHNVISKINNYIENNDNYKS